MQRYIRIPFAVLVILVGLNSYVWYSFAHPGSNDLKVSVLDVGQGDSILVEGPTGIQMLVDGGPDNAVLRDLPQEMGILDRSLDLVVETHPDKDHIAGLVGVFKKYVVGYALTPGIPNDTATTAALDDAFERERDLTQLTARRGMRIHLGGGAYADVLYPDHDVSHEETNNGSIVMRVVYGTTSFMLTGDAPSDVEQRILNSYEQSVLTSTVLKAGHHGSKYSTSDMWLSTLNPSYVAISAGVHNSYGHPSKETLDRVSKQGAQIVRTSERGTLRFVSNGRMVTLQ